MEYLKGLNPETLAVVGALMILREVFAFLKSRQIDKVQATDSELVQTLGKINENIDTNTQLTRTLVSHMEEFSRKQELMRRELDELTERVKLLPRT